MLVSDLLGDRRPPVTIAPNATIQQAADALAEHKIGALIVSSDGQTLAGILSERDIVRALSRVGGSVLERMVSTLMTEDVTTCTLKTQVSEVMGMMVGKGFRHVPVVEDGKILGIVSIRDTVAAHVHALEAEAAEMKNYITGL